MDFRNPFATTGPTLEAAVLRVITRTNREMTVGDVHRLSVEGSSAGLRLALNRLAAQGLVEKRPAGRAFLYRFNQDHLVAPWIEGLGGVRDDLFDRMRAEIGRWQPQPLAAAVFGSVARGEAGPESDIDIALVRPPNLESDDAWGVQVTELIDAVSRWTGNDARPVEFTLDDFSSGVEVEPLIQDILAEGIEVGGSLTGLRRSVS